MSEIGIDPGLLEEARARLKGAVKVAALTGAGISAESGVSTFRGSEGLWEKYRPEELASPEAFQRDPQLVWEWYNWRRGMMIDKMPNPGHLALANLESTHDFTLITQNVDGLHALAGSRNILEIHGSIWRVRCIDCGRQEVNRTAPLPYPPACTQCDGLLRPDVVWFGESLDSDLLARSLASASRAEVMLVVGTSALVHPAAGLAWQARRTGAYLIEINTERTPFSDDAHAVLTGPSGQILPQLIG